jgi:hypothetical protein
LWAINLRTKPDRDINIIKKAGLGDLFETRWSIDTTVPFKNKWRQKRPVYEKVDLWNLAARSDIENGLALMSDSAREYSMNSIIKPLI